MVKNRYTITLLFAIGVIVLSMLGYRYQLSTISIQKGGFTFESSIAPSITPQDVYLKWEVDGIAEIYLNGRGVIGKDTRTFDSYCSTVEFKIVMKDGFTQEFTLYPFVWFTPVNFLLIFTLLGSVLGIISTLFTQTVQKRLSDIIDVRQSDYYGCNGIFWFQILLLSMVLICLPMILFPTCLNGDYSEIALAILTFNTLIASVSLLVSLLKSAILNAIQNWLAYNIPYPLTIAVVFIYWALVYSIDPLELLGDVSWLLLVIIHLLGVFILVAAQNKQERIITLNLSTSSFKYYSVVTFVVFIGFIIYITPWTSSLNNYVLQTFIGLGLFIFPGILLVAAIFTPNHIRWTRLITLGFVVSIFLASALSIVCIILGLSSTVFKLMFTMVGGLALIYTLLRRRTFNITYMTRVSLTLHDTIFLSFGMVALLVLMVRGINPNVSPATDFTSYNAMVMEFAQSTHFSLKDPFLGTNNLMEPRLWLIAWPVSQALIVNFSSLNIIQVISDLNILLVVFVALAIYDLMRSHKISSKFALLAIIFTAFAIVTQEQHDQIGAIFTARLTQDKVLVAWILTPIMLTTVYDYIRNGGKRQQWLTVLVAVTSVSTHATAFFYMALISGIVASLYVLFQSGEWRRIIILAVIFAACTAIPLILGELSANMYTWNIEGLENINSMRLSRLAIHDDFALLGINPNLRSGPAFITVYVATIIAIVNIKREPLSYYIIACCILIISVSNPITAPLLGEFVTPFHLWRATWFMPFGIAGAFCIWILFQRSSFLPAHLSNLIVLIITITLTGHVICNLQIMPRDQYHFLEEFRNIVKQIDREPSDGQTIVLTSYNRSILLPSLEWDLHPIVWRTSTYEQTGVSKDEHDERHSDHERFFASDLDTDEFEELIDKYQVDNIILDKTSNSNLIDLIKSNPRITHIQTFEKLVLWQVTTQ